MKCFPLLIAAVCFAAAGFAAEKVASPEQVQTEIRRAATPADRLGEEWWKERCEEKLKLAKELGPRAKILFLGDSITHFWETHGKEVFDRDFRQYNTLDVGFSGDSTRHLIWIVEKSGIMDSLDPQLVVMMIGTNNSGNQEMLIGRTGVDSTVAGIRRGLESVKARFPKAKILLFAIFPRGRTVDDPARKLNEKVNPVIQKFADGKNVFWVDICGQFLNPDGTVRMELMVDSVHPGKGGYEIWSAAIMPYVKKFVK